MNEKNKEPRINDVIFAYIDMRYAILNNIGEKRSIEDFEKMVGYNYLSLDEEYIENLITFFSENAVGTFDDVGFDQIFFLDTLLHIHLVLFPDCKHKFSYDIMKSKDEHLTAYYSQLVNTK